MDHGNLTGVQPGQFVRMNDDSYAEYGVPNGSLLYVAGDAVVHTNEEDPYALRRIFIATKLDVMGRIVPELGGFTVDGTRLSPVGDEEQAELDLIRASTFSEPEEVSATTH